MDICRKSTFLHTLLRRYHTDIAIVVPSNIAKTVSICEVGRFNIETDAADCLVSTVWNASMRCKIFKEISFFDNKNITGDCAVRHPRIWRLYQQSGQRSLTRLDLHLIARILIHFLLQHAIDKIKDFLVKRHLEWRNLDAQVIPCVHSLSAGKWDKQNMICFPLGNVWSRIFAARWTYPLRVVFHRFTSHEGNSYPKLMNAKCSAIWPNITCRFISNICWLIQFRSHMYKVLANNQ